MTQVETNAYSNADVARATEWIADRFPDSNDASSFSAGNMIAAYRAGLAAAKAGASVQISREDAEVIINLMEGLGDPGLWEGEVRVLARLRNAGNFGRPVPKHGSGA
ncbi:hypothetical protein EN780_03365 [Mesorhizobium sp. M4B.F.Ca.ET.089.01.1.1]|uniref:hypothetical protein n=1 Tax=Mesorhizobium sp. M4B.F.Ca.ET.089.01.1.1 TaxID=2496662 RepID=UPI000FE3F75A|nr:hypothetical protein [Mesorhizobium sp. M4B.F.Ca.ET.089.01.1.1]RWX70447.1 hypothetical protein EN780_03365 [Mesorhizobium sp. M4B.F.Ca.ET.089.01.1.1]